MTDNIIIEALQKFLQERVAGKIKLQAPAKDIDTYGLVHPAVHVGWIPPKLPENISPESQVTDIPCIIVGMDEGEDDGDSASLNIRLSFVTFSEGLMKDGKLYPNYEGYKDLINLIALTRRELSAAVTIGSVTSVQRPFKWGMYKDQPAPYWYGWMTFSVVCAVMGYISGLKEQYE